jgi:hypothetical protein
VNGERTVAPERNLVRAGQIRQVVRAVM